MIKVVQSAGAPTTAHAVRIHIELYDCRHQFGFYEALYQKEGRGRERLTCSWHCGLSECVCGGTYSGWDE